MKTWIWPLKFSKGAAPRRRCFSPLRARTRTIAEKSRKVGSNPLSVAVVYCMPSCHALGCFNYHSHTWPPTLHLRMCATNPPKSPSLHRRSVCAAKSSIFETCLAVCGAAIFLLENDSSGLSKANFFSEAPPPTPQIQDPSLDAPPRHPGPPVTPPRGAIPERHRGPTSVAGVGPNSRAPHPSQGAAAADRTAPPPGGFHQLTS